jgi:sarcosine oxidase, subunit beta
MKTVVVGAGYHGCSIAYHLARAGIDTVLIDKGEIGDGASGGNFGCVQLSDSEPGLSLLLNTRGFNRMSLMEEELGCPIEYRRVPSLSLAQTEEELEELKSTAAEKQSSGIDVRMLSKDEIQGLEPNLNTDTVIGGNYFLQAQINPFLYMRGMVNRGREAGLRVEENTKAARITEKGGRCTGVRLASGGQMEAENVVIAAGAWTKKLCGPFGIDIPVNYVIGECFVTEPVDPYMYTAIGMASFYTTTHGSEGPATSFTAVQNQSGNILLAETSEPGPADPDEALQLTSRQHCTGIFENTARLFPELQKISIIRNWTTCSPSTPTLEPVLGPAGPEGLFIASGFKSSVVISSVAGEIIRDLVTEGRTFCDLTQYTPADS